MEKMKIIFNKQGNTIDVWFDDPKKESICEETGEELILKKDKKGRLIGIEKLNVSHTKKADLTELPLEFIVK